MTLQSRRAAKTATRLNRNRRFKDPIDDFILAARAILEGIASRIAHRPFLSPRSSTDFAW
ncbi:hypothetical protein P7L53_12570 [Thermoleptolyngbya sichuanensis XZ-Cy5]|uniref:hypothetical protein n=1 Tax=Thermoleptolyngbya sichuanensis TaxID=2885951 RepID=UPI00240E165D|nr:hypothetical protein [Thermoleptolyngbya sichuanensis]MDG2617074.1 hypothetical protein [Thermoleptolyngbya sichuanensis XZ-Cy5]